MGQCPTYEKGTPNCDYRDFDDTYYVFLRKFNFEQAVIAMVGVYTLYLRFATQKLPIFMTGVSVCIVYSTLLARAYSVMKSRTIEAGPGDSNFIYE